jgi:hypothetical protein
VRLAFLFVSALALAQAGCSVSLRSDEICDGELKAHGLWTDADARARRLLENEPPPRFGTAADPERPIRNPELSRKLYDVLVVNGLEIPVPAPTHAIGYVLGLRWDPRYYYLSGARAYVFLERGAPPIIISDDDAADETPAKRAVPAPYPDIVQRIADQVCTPIELPVSGKVVVAGR